MAKSPDWTKEEIDFVLQNRGSMTYAEMRNFIDRSPSAITNMLFSKKLLNKSPRYTIEEAKFVADNWHKLSTQDIARHLGRPSTSVSMHAQRAGLPLKTRIDKSYKGPSKVLPKKVNQWRIQDLRKVARNIDEEAREVSQWIGIDPKTVASMQRYLLKGQFPDIYRP